jgi:hypothetical protein
MRVGEFVPPRIPATRLGAYGEQQLRVFGTHSAVRFLACDVRRIPGVAGHLSLRNARSWDYLRVHRVESKGGYGQLGSRCRRPSRGRDCLVERINAMLGAKQDLWPCILRTCNR